MSERSTLISRKDAVRARLTQLRHELERERLQPHPRTKRIRQIEEDIDRLMAEEHDLRQQIDRSV